MRPDGPRPSIVGPDMGPQPPFPLKLNGKVIKGFGRGSKELGIPTANIPIEGLTVGGHKDVDSGIYFGWAGLDIELPPPPPASSAASTSSPPRSSSSSDPSSFSANAHPVPTQNTAVIHDSHNGITDGTSEKDEEKEDKPPTKQSEKDVGVGVDVGGPVMQNRGYVFPMVMSIGWNPFYGNTVRSVEVHLLHTFPKDFYNHHMNLIILGFIRPEYDYVDKESLIEDIHEDIRISRRSLAREAYEWWKEDEYLWDFEGGDVAC